VFRELLDDFKNKLPSTGAVATKLENQRFNAERAKAAAIVLEKSLRYSGVLDNSNNILPVRSGPGGNGRKVDHEDNVQDDQIQDEPLPPNTLSVDIPLAEGRKVNVRYPQDISQAEAKKVGAVLAAIVG
jgi:hypothetical protein